VVNGSKNAASKDEADFHAVATDRWLRKSLKTRRHRAEGQGSDYRFK